MKVVMSLWILQSLLINISAQQCTIEEFEIDATNIMVISTELASGGVSTNITSTYYKCLSISDTSDHYSSMSVSILYIRSDSPNNTHEVRYNLQCNNSEWKIVGNQSTALMSYTSNDCFDCTNQTVNDYHCTSKLIHCIKRIDISVPNKKI